MSCKHGNHEAGCELCDAEDAAYLSGQDSGNKAYALLLSKLHETDLALAAVTAERDALKSVNRILPELKDFGIHNAEEAMRKTLRKKPQRLKDLSVAHPAIIVRELCKMVIEAESALAEAERRGMERAIDVLRGLYWGAFDPVKAVRDAIEYSDRIAAAEQVKP